VLVQSDAIARARDAFNLLNAIGNWLPIIALIFLALGVYVAKGHRRALVGAGLGLAGGMLTLGLGIALFRAIYLNAIPAEVLPHDAAAAFYDTLVRFLRLGLRTVLVLGLVVALAGFLTGRSTTAVRTRAGLSKGIGWLRGGAEKAGFRTGPVGAWVYTYKRVLWIVVIAIAALVLVFWDQPTGRVIIGITLAVLVALVIIEFLGRPPSPIAPEAPEAEAPATPDVTLHRLLQLRSPAHKLATHLKPMCGLEMSNNRGEHAAGRYRRKYFGACRGVIRPSMLCGVAYVTTSGQERYIALADDLVLRAVRDLLARRGRGAGTPCLQGWSAMAGRHGSNDINGYIKGLLGERCTARRINRVCSRPTLERQDVVDGKHGCSHGLCTKQTPHS
jgi:hypothetical protein